ncbi:hypothetical protein VR41_07455 [Streptomyces sp. NRRL B-1568]|nr:hypothetical protein VR41_07455 [Streptomyces sp. NRRL B-1568]
MNAHAGFPLPDLTTSLPRAPFEFSPAAGREAAEALAERPGDLFRRLLRDQESQTTWLLARRLIEAFLPGPGEDGGHEAEEPDAEAIAAEVAAGREGLAQAVADLRDLAPETRELVLRQRAPLALMSGCWLDTVSQPATQPSVVVNRLYGQHFRLLGSGNVRRGLPYLRRRALEGLGVYLPEIEDVDFLRKAEARALTELHGSFYLALSRLPASFLPEVVGVHYAVHALGIDDGLTGSEPFFPEPELREVIEEFLACTAQAPTGAEDRRRMLRAVRLVLRLEREHVEMLTELAAWHQSLSLDAKVAAIVARHAEFAGRQHRAVKMGDRKLSDWLDDPELDVAAFMAEFRQSRQMQPTRQGGCRFLRSIKFGGPMFGIFDEREAATFTAWAEAIAAGEPAEPAFVPNTAGDTAARAWSDAIARTEPQDIALAEPGALDDRQFFHRLVNIEHFPSTLPLARERAEAGLADAEILFTHGAGGRYTNAEYFDYTPEALLERVDRIYRDKLVDPYRPLTEIPDRDEVIFGQKTFAQGSLIDGTWAHRIANLGRRNRESDTMLFSIYADEMGRGDLAKNHITIIHQVLASMSVHLPHIRQDAFLDQDELPDHLYAVSIHQICLSLFPDTLYNEILGYNLGIEMFGLGEMRLHEIQKLRRYHFDTTYEEAHLSIDNVSAGHARQSADIIVSYLDGVQRNSGAAAVQEEWRRIWRGYASFAYFVESGLVRTALTQPAPPQAESVDLVI